MLAKQFGRDISNVQRPAGFGKKPVAKKQRVVSKPSNYTVSQTEVSVHHREDNKPKRKEEKQAKSIFDNSTSTATNPFASEESYFSDNDVESMSIDDIQEIVHEDIDRYDTHDPQFVSDYITDIMEFLKEKEIAVQISSDYCSKQKDIKPRHRNQLIRWIAEVYFQLKLLAETYFLAVNIVDQVLDACLVSRKKLHLIGVTAIFIASKYEETWAPPLNDLRICCDNQFTEKDILTMEREILNRINFNLCIPAPIHFLRRYSKAGHSDGLTHTIAKFITEMTCQSYAMLKFLPSQIAAASVLMARQIRGEYDELWDSNLRHYSGYEVEDLIECGQTMTSCIYKELTSSKTQCAIVRKYSDRKLLAVANIVAQVLCK